MKLKLRRKRPNASPRIRFDLEKLQDPTIASAFQAQLGGKFAALNLLDSDINELAGGFRDAVLETAEVVLGRDRKKKCPWVSNAILDLCDKRKALKGAKHTSPEAAEEYRCANKMVRSKMKEAKENDLSTVREDRERNERRQQQRSLQHT